MILCQSYDSNTILSADVGWAGQRSLQSAARNCAGRFACYTDYSPAHENSTAVNMLQRSTMKYENAVPYGSIRPVRSIRAVLFSDQSTRRAQSLFIFLCELCVLCGYYGGDVGAAHTMPARKFLPQRAQSTQSYCSHLCELCVLGGYFRRSPHELRSPTITKMLAPDHNPALRRQRIVIRLKRCSKLIFRGARL